MLSLVIVTPRTFKSHHCLKENEIMTTSKNFADALALIMLVSLNLTSSAAELEAPTSQDLHRTVKVDGLDIFYREAGPKDAPTILLLHGFPTSSHMFRNLIPALADK